MLANEDGTEEAIDSEGLTTRFQALCDIEMDKINRFYASKEEELLTLLDGVKDEISQVEEEGAFGDIEEDSDDESGGESGDEDAGFLKRGGKLLTSFVTGGGMGSSNLVTRKREGSSEEERSLAAPINSSRRRSTSGTRTHARKRSNTGSDISSTDPYTHVNMREDLPSEMVHEVDKQIDRTMQAATSTISSQPQQQLPNGEASSSHPPLPSPQPVIAASKRRPRSSSFGAGGGSTTDIWSSSSRRAVDMRITFKLRIQALFRDLSQLKEYISLNQSEHVPEVESLTKRTGSSLLLLMISHSRVPQNHQKVR